MTLHRGLSHRFWLFLLSVCFASHLFSPTYAQAKKRPQFIHSVPPSVQAGRPLTIQGTISNLSDLDYVDFRYRLLGKKGAPYRTIRMKQKGGKFSVFLRGTLLKAPGLEYYVIAMDFNQKKYLLAGSPALPKQFLVVGGAEEIDKPGKRPSGGGSGDNGGGDNGGGDNGGGSGDNDGTTPKPVKRGKGEVVSRELAASVASRRKQPLLWSPGTVSVITAQDIEHYGWRTLMGILRFATGFDINDNGSWADIGIRGLNLPGNRGRRIKFLIDGHDMAWRQREQNMLSTAWISVDDIERIEIFRGAAPAMWGSGAQAATVQIITKNGRTMNGFSATMGVGPLSGSHFFGVRGGQQFKSGFSFYTSFSLTQEFRSPVLAPIYEFGQLDETLSYTLPNSRTMGQNFFAKIGWKGAFLTIQQGRYDANAPINQYDPIGGDDSRYVTDRIALRAGWDGKVSKNVRLRLWASYDRYQFSPGSAIEFNALSSAKSSESQRGNSLTYNLTKPNKDKVDFVGTYPTCNDIGDVKAACIRITTVETTDPQGKKQREAVCILQKAPTEAPATTVNAAEKFQKWFPMSNCNPMYSNGRYVSKLQAADNRIQLGVNVHAQIGKSFHLFWGAEFEYLASVLWHFREDWERRVQDNALTEDNPDYTNFRVSTYLQGQYQYQQLLSFHAAARLDYDQRFGARFSPQAALIVHPGAGSFAKAHYGWGFVAPSLYDYYHVEQNRYGNALLRPEEVQSIGVQLGWMKKSLMMIGVSGFFSMYSSPITYLNRQAGEPVEGRGEDESQYDFLPPSGAYRQLSNNTQGYTALGGELEARLFPINGVELLGHFGIALASRTLEDGTTERLFYSAGLYGGLSASYRAKLQGQGAFVASLGLLYVGTKLVAGSNYAGGGTLPTRDLLDKQIPQRAPGWEIGKDPRIPAANPALGPIAPGYVKVHITLQMLRIAGHFDIALRAQNITGAFGNTYDAGDPFLLPHKRFEVLTWIRLHY